MSHPMSTFLEVLTAERYPEVRAGGLIRAARYLQRQNPRLAENIVRNQWLKIAPQVLEVVCRPEVDSRVYAAAILVEAYFRCRGDWLAMEKSVLSQPVTVPADLMERTVESLAQSLWKAGMNGNGES